MTKSRNFYSITMLEKRESENIHKTLVLIGCPGVGKSYLPGVRMDMESLWYYHQTPKGGGWVPEEIVVLWAPTRREVLETISAVKGDFLRVYFCGHGYAELAFEEPAADGGLVDVRKLVLKGDEVVRDLELVNRQVERQEIICDCCRKRPGEKISGIPEKLEEVPFTEEEFQLARRLFNRLIWFSPKGLLIIHSTGDGKAAYDTEEGGQFTVALLENALRWMPQVEGIPVGVNGLLKMVERQLGRAKAPQRPEVVLMEGNITVPFALGTLWPGNGEFTIPPGRDADRAAGDGTVVAHQGQALLALGGILFGAWLLNELF